ncbi:DNA-directed DNA polymerase [Tanacetum coccineum]
MIDVFNKKITLRVGDDEVIFDVDQSIKRPTTEDDECYGIDDLDDTINKEAQELLANKEPNSFLSKGLEKSIDQSDLECCESTDSNNDDDLIQKIDMAINSVNTPNEIDEKKPELKNLPQHLEYAYLHGDKSFPIIISSKLYEKEKMSLLQVSEKLKGAITWKMSDIKGISRQTIVHGLALFTLCQKGRGFFQIPIALEDQEKTTFTCPYRTFAYRRMPFGLCNAPATFQRCMTTIFHDVVDDFMEVFRDDFSVYVIMEYLVNISKRRAFWSFNEDILKISILTTNMSYPSRKIRRIRACTHQRPQRKEDQYAVSREGQYAVLEI